MGYLTNILNNISASLKLQSRVDQTPIEVDNITPTITLEEVEDISAAVSVLDPNNPQSSTATGYWADPPATAGPSQIVLQIMADAAPRYHEYVTHGRYASIAPAEAQPAILGTYTITKEFNIAADGSGVICTGIQTTLKTATPISQLPDRTIKVDLGATEIKTGPSVSAEMKLGPQ